jgi:hypothetical protein
MVENGRGISEMILGDTKGHDEKKDSK